MWRHLVFSLWLAACGASEGRAQIQVITRMDGDVRLVNLTGSPFAFDGYQILDVTGQGRLRYESLRSVESLIAAGKVGEVLETLGVGALGFAEAGLSPNSFTELTAVAGAILASGTRWSLGPIFPHYESHSSSRGFECSFSTQFGEINVDRPFQVFEPVSGALGLSGVIATSMFLARRRK